MIPELSVTAINTAFSDIATDVISLVTTNISVLLPVAAVILGVYVLLRFAKRVAR